MSPNTDRSFAMFRPESGNRAVIMRTGRFAAGFDFSAIAELLLARCSGLPSR